MNYRRTDFYTVTLSIYIVEHLATKYYGISLCMQHIAKALPVELWLKTESDAHIYQ